MLPASLNSCRKGTEDLVWSQNRPPLATEFPEVQIGHGRPVRVVIVRAEDRQVPIGGPPAEHVVPRIMRAVNEVSKPL